MSDLTPVPCPRPRCRGHIDEARGFGVCCAACVRLIPTAIRGELERCTGQPALRSAAQLAAMRALLATVVTDPEPQPTRRVYRKGWHKRPKANA